MIFFVEEGNMIVYMQNDFFHIQTTIDRDTDITIIIFDNFAPNLEKYVPPKKCTYMWKPIYQYFWVSSICVK